MVFFATGFFGAALLAAAAFFAAFTGAFFTAVFLEAVFFLAAGFGFAVAVFFAAHRFFNAATIAALPALLSFRLGFEGVVVADGAGLDSPRIFAHRRCWASFIRRRAAAENFLRLRIGASGVAAAVDLLPPSTMARSSAICWSIRVFYNSKPSMAAVMIS